ncbi:MAG: helix-turn-helix domain-containing protein [Acidobacteriota bacterium]
MADTKKDLPRFSEFVRRVLKLKGLTQKDVQRISRGRITDGYIASITVGRATNLSVAKIKALADGLGVDVDTLFQVACGVPEDKVRRTYTDDALTILETVQKVVTSPDVSEILKEAVRMSPKERSLLLKSMKQATTSKSTRTTKRPRKQAP